MLGTRGLTCDVESIYGVHGDIAHDRAWGGKNSELRGVNIGYLQTMDTSEIMTDFDEQIPGKAKYPEGVFVIMREFQSLRYDCGRNCFLARRNI